MRCSAALGVCGSGRSLGMESLHPNLARISAAYDEIFGRWAAGLIDAQEAETEITALVARDDEGILWSIDPSSGAWLRRTVSGALVRSEPPSFGFATPTPHDMAHSDVFNPDSLVDMIEVADDLVVSPTALAGATRRVPSTDPLPSDPGRRLVQLAAVVAAVIVVLFGARACASDGAETAPGSEQSPPAVSSSDTDPAAVN